MTTLKSGMRSGCVRMQAAARGTLGTRAPPADGRRVHLRRPRRPSAGGNWPRNPLLPLLLFLFPFPPFPPFFFSLLFPSFLLSFALISLNFFALRVKYTAPRFFFALRAKNTAPKFFSPLRGVWNPRPCGTLVHRLRGLRGVRRAWDPRHLPRRNAGFFSSARQELHWEKGNLINAVGAVAAPPPLPAAGGAAASRPLVVSAARPRTPPTTYPPL